MLGRPLARQDWRAEIEDDFLEGALNKRGLLRRSRSPYVQRLRRGRALSQEELAHRADVHRAYLSGVEGGNVTPRLVFWVGLRRRWASTSRSFSDDFGLSGGE
jgi:DNA-binding XRE family transcriptional regulator